MTTDDTKREHERDIATLKADVRAIAQERERDREACEAVRTRGHENSTAIHALRIVDVEHDGRLDRLEEHHGKGSERMDKIEGRVEAVEHATIRQAGFLGGVVAVVLVAMKLLGF